MGIILLIVLMAVVMLLMPAMPLLLAKMGAGRDALEASFAQQSAPCSGGTVPATQLSVLHRRAGLASYDQTGDLMQVDASWLCRAPDGSYLLALGQGLRLHYQLSVMPWNRAPLDIHWTWRALSEAQARQLVSHDPTLLS